MRKIKVAEVITRMDWGGAPDIYRILAGHLDGEIYDTTLIFGDTKNPTKKTKCFLEKFAGRVLVVPNMKREIDPVVDLAALAGLIAIFAKGKFDIVHTHTAKAGALGRIAAKLCGVPAIIHTPHGHNFYGYFDDRTTGMVIKTERFLSRYTDRIIALTELEKKDCLKFKIAPEEKIDVIYQGLELDKTASDWKETDILKRELGISAGDNVVGMIGRLEPVKGPEFFLEAAAIIAKKISNIKFIIAGEGSLKKMLKERSASLGLGDKVVITGWRDDVHKVLSVLGLHVQGVKKTSWEQQTFEIWTKRWANFVFSLPATYSLDSKLKCIMDHGVKSGLFSFSSIKRLRKKRQFNIKIYRKYARYFPFTINYPLFIMRMLFFFPSWLLRLFGSKP